MHPLPTRHKQRCIHVDTLTYASYVVKTMKKAATLFSPLFLLSHVLANYPLFDESTKMRLLLVPEDTRVGSIIYRLRATDSDYDFPLAFEVLGRAGKNVIRLETLPCARNHSACEANVILTHALRRNNLYTFRLSVRDSRGDPTSIEATIQATNGSSVTALNNAFPRYTTLVSVPENTKPGTELEYILVRKSDMNTRHAYLELSGSPIFSMKQRLAGRDVSNGTIILNDELDFEKQNLYPMLLYASEPYVTPNVDTRNILGFELVIAVTDVQDTPPVFIHAPPVTTLSPRVQPGDVILHVEAEDGDKGRPRQIRYGLLSEGNPFTPFFSIDEDNGEVRLTRSLNDLRAITQPFRPVMLRVLAEEIITVEDSSHNDISTVAELAIILPGSVNTPPYFESETYVATVAEGSAPGTPLIFTDPWMPRVRDNDMGLGAVFALSLENDNGTFEVSPTVVDGSANFMVRVKNNAMLDYERYPILTFKVVASEVSQSNPISLTASASVTVRLTDVNDNAPTFEKPMYSAELPENVTAGTFVAQVQAEDSDSGKMGKVRYTRLIGQLNGSLALDPETGRITVATNNHGIDREEAPEYRLYVEARDEAGDGQPATVPLVISVIDINDHAPTFEYQDYEIFLGPENKNFTTRIFLKATDADAEPPNNEIRYEIMSGNVGEKFSLNEMTGELTVKQMAEKRLKKRSYTLERKEPSMYFLNVRAYDLGVPHKWSRADVRVHSAGSDPPLAGSVVFIVPKSPAAVLADPRATERFLAGLTGGRVAIREVRPYRPGALHNDPNTKDFAPDVADADKSIVVALVTYVGEPAVVDVAQMQQRLMANQTTNTVIVKEYRADSSGLFWFLLFLALLLAIIILTLIVCFFHSGCPLYHSRKDRRTPRSAEEVRLVLERGVPRDDSDKIILRREAWSADGGTRRYLQFNRRNILTLDHRPNGDEGRNAIAPADGPQHHEAAAAPAGPNIIYTRELQQQQQPPANLQPVRHRQRDVLLEDVESDYPSSRNKQYTARESLGTVSHSHPNIIFVKDSDGQRIFVHQEESADEIDSMRRHEMERGSDVGQVRYVMRERSAPTTQAEPEIVEVLTLDEEEANGREQHYVKDGNAEVLRLITRGKQDDRLSRRRINQTDAGKDIIMRRFMEDQRQHINMGADTALPGQVLHQTGTQTDEERGTQTENDSLNSPNIETPPTINTQMEHAKHVIKSPILEESESYLEQVQPGKRMPRDKRVAQEPIACNDSDDDYEKGKGETEFNYGDTKASTLRRQKINEKSGADSKALDDKKKGNGKGAKKSDSKPHRSQSLPRVVKRRSSSPDMQKSMRQKSTSINSGLDKASRVTFASPEHVHSDEEVYPSTSRTKQSSLNVGNSLRTSSTSLNKSAATTPQHRKNRRNSTSDDERNNAPKKNTILRRSSSNVSINKPLQRRPSFRDASHSDDESTHKPQAKKKVTTSNTRSVPTKQTATSAKKDHKSRSEFVEGDNIKKSSSLRITKASSSRKSSVSPAFKSRRNSCSDDEKSAKATRNSTSVSPAVRTRKLCRGNTSDDEASAKKGKTPSKPPSVKISRNVRKSQHDLDSEKKSRAVASKTKNSLASKTEKESKEIKRNPVKSRDRRENNSDTDSDDSIHETVRKKHAILSPSVIKAKSPTYEARVKRLDQEMEDDVHITLSPAISNESPNSSTTSLQTVTNVKISKETIKEVTNNELLHHNNVEEIADDKNNRTESESNTIKTNNAPPSNNAPPLTVTITQTSPPKPKESLETAMQTDVTLVPLINSMGRIDDDLDSGIAMSLTATDGRSRRLNQLIEKKSIFTIAYDDMQTKQLRADSASPQY